MAFGGILAGIDLLLRARERDLPETRGKWRWIGPFAGGHCFFLPLWALGAIALLLALWLVGSANFWWLTD